MTAPDAAGLGAPGLVLPVLLVLAPEHPVLLGGTARFVENLGWNLELPDVTEQPRRMEHVDLAWLESQLLGDHRCIGRTRSE